MIVPRSGGFHGAEAGRLGQVLDGWWLTTAGVITRPLWVVKSAMVRTQRGTSPIRGGGRDDMRACFRLIPVGTGRVTVENNKTGLAELGRQPPSCRLCRAGIRGTKVH